MELESKFIEGTNKQYSIRNDGVVIRHFSIVSNQFITTRIVYRDKIVKQNLVNRKINPENKAPYVRVLLYSLDGKKREINVKVLVIKYFTNIKLHSNIKIVNKDGNVFNCSLDNLEIQRVHSNYLSLPRALTRKEVNNKKKLDITKGYVANQINMSAKDLTEELYQEYKALLLVKRLLVQETNCSFNSLR